MMASYTAIHASLGHARRMALFLERKQVAKKTPVLYKTKERIYRFYSIEQFC